MHPSTPSFPGVLRDLEQWVSYENTAHPEDISRLDGIRQLLGFLEHPHQKLSIIHIAGTNGKGQTALMLGTLLTAEGVSCGIYSSPHLTDIRERICLNGQLIPKAEFATCGAKVLEVAHSFQGEPNLSYFDILTAIALLACRRAGIQWVILETGLGGRVDSTNVTEKELCILTQIGMDHQDVLGNSLHEIATEKLGITRPGIPLILARQSEELKPWLLQKLGKAQVPVVDVETELSILSADEKTLFTNNSTGGLLIWKDGSRFNIPKSAAINIPWLECMRTAMTAVEVLRPFSEKERIKRFDLLCDVRMPARLELRRQVVWKDFVFNWLVLDGGHNADALNELAGQLARWGFSKCVLLLGMSRDKLNQQLLPALLKLLTFTELILPCPFLSPRSATSRELRGFLEVVRELDQLPKIECIPNAEAGLERAAKNHGQPLIVAGSFYLAGEVIALLDADIIRPTRNYRSSRRV